MSSSLEYLPLFIFVLTLTYKKKKEKQLKKNTPNNKKNVLMLEKEWSISPSVTSCMGTGPGGGCCTQVLILGCPGQREPLSFLHLDAAR